MKNFLIAFAIAVISGIIILIVQYTFFEKKDKVSPVKVELSTNKGNSKIDLYKGDTLKLYIETNQECYIRLIYLMADQSNVLLLENYYIKSNLVNEKFEIPDKFICSEPFGSEKLIIYAQKEPFLPLKTIEKNNYILILNNIDEINDNIQRGLKKLSNIEMYANQNIEIQTIDK